MAVLFATNANAVGVVGIQVNIGELPKAQIALISPVSAEQTENPPQSDEAEAMLKEIKLEETRSGRIKKPVVRGLSGKKKIQPSDTLSLTLSMTLSITGNASTQPASPIKTSDASQGEPVTKERRLSELYAQIAETEKMIKAQQRQLDMLPNPPASDAAPATVADVLAQNPVGDVPVAKPARNEGVGLIGLIGENWLNLAIGLALSLLAVFGFEWYRKGRAAHRGKRRKLQVASDVRAKTELVQPPVIAKTPVPAVEQSIKTPAYAEQKIQSILPPEYEMLEEADIYLRFGHDKLAEEALREAIKINPGNPQAYLTLSRIYFSREDSVAFLALATQLKSLGDENVWNKVAEMGRNLDPNNTFYS